MMVWIIGSHGMLGSQLCRTLKANNISFIGTGREVSITDFSALNDFISDKNISFIVNCAAYTAVDKAENEVEKAYSLNSKGAENIARLSKKISVPLIHISTDYVFDGSASTPITEDSPISPLGVYGKSKADGEKSVIENCDDFYILRTAWLYGFYGKNFVYTMIRLINSRDNLKVVSDQKGTPTNCTTLSTVITKIIQKQISGEKVPYGIYHVTDNGETTWFDFAKEIYKIGKSSEIIINSNCVINPFTTEEYAAGGTTAKRPEYSVLSKEKIQTVLKITLPDWKTSLKDFINSLCFDKSLIER